MLRGVTESADKLKSRGGIAISSDDFVRKFLSMYVRYGKFLPSSAPRSTKLFAALTIISDKCAYGNRAEHGIEGPCRRCDRTGNEDVRRSEGMQKKKWVI